MNLQIYKSLSLNDVSVGLFFLRLSILFNIKSFDKQVHLNHQPWL